MLIVAKIQEKKRQNKPTLPTPLSPTRKKKIPAVENFRRNKSKDLERKEISNSLDNWQGAKKFLFKKHLCFDFGYHCAA